MENIDQVLAPFIASQRKQKKNQIKIFVSRSLSFDEEKKRTIVHFIQYVDRSLGLEKDYGIYLVSDRKKYGIETTAGFVENKVLVYGKGRLLVDIMRSIAHELVHAKQDEMGQQVSRDFLHFSNESEDEANEIAGEIINAYTEVMGRQVYDL